MNEARKILLPMLQDMKPSNLIESKRDIDGNLEFDIFKFSSIRNY